MKSGFWGLLIALIVAGLFWSSGLASAQSEYQRQILEELRWQNFQQQQRQYGEELREQQREYDRQHQRRMDEIERTGKESQRSLDRAFPGSIEILPR